MKYGIKNVSKIKVLNREKCVVNCPRKGHDLMEFSTDYKKLS